MARTSPATIKLVGIYLIIMLLSLVTACSSKTTTTTVTATPIRTIPVIEITPTSVKELIELEPYLSIPVTFEENKILSVILDSLEDDSGYAVISPYVYLVTSIEIEKEYFIKVFKEQGYDITNLINQLVENNSHNFILSIRSSVDQGYFVDYASALSVFFNNVSGVDGWNNLRKYFPEVRSYNATSIPAYDPITGYILVRLGGTSDYMVYENRLVLYQYKDDKLTELASYIFTEP